MQIARLIKANVGLEVAFAEMRRLGYARQRSGRSAGAGPARQPAGPVRKRAGGVLPGPGRPHGRRQRRHHERVRAHRAENGTRGTDHGHANVMFALGGGIRGGKVYGDGRASSRSSSTSSGTSSSPPIFAMCSASWWCATWGMRGWRACFRVTSSRSSAELSLRLTLALGHALENTFGHAVDHLFFQRAELAAVPAFPALKIRSATASITRSRIWSSTPASSELFRIRRQSTPGADDPTRPEFLS